MYPLFQRKFWNSIGKEEKNVLSWVFFNIIVFLAIFVNPYTTVLPNSFNKSFTT